MGGVDGACKIPTGPFVQQQNQWYTQHFFHICKTTFQDQFPIHLVEGSHAVQTQITYCTELYYVCISVYLQ